MMRVLGGVALAVFILLPLVQAGVLTLPLLKILQSLTH
jgi:hypothetical protein